MLIHLKSGLFVLAGLYLLSACSSNPSPWSESASPWGNKSDQSEVVAEESAGAEQHAFVEPIPEPVEIVTPVEPVVAEPGTEEMPVSPVINQAPVTRNKAISGDLSSQPAEYFAVQVCASRSMKQLEGFAKRHNVSTQWTAQTNVNNETWFVLLEGVYATRGEAAQALALMKSEVDTRPWIRTVGSLHAVMR